MRSRSLVLLVATLLLTTACSRGSDDDGDTSEPTSTSTSSGTSTTTTREPVPTSTTTTTVGLPPPVPVRWSSCGGGFQCGTVAVPVRYQDPGGPTLDLALVKNPADVPSERIGTLLVNPGGPGASGVRRVARGFEIAPEVGDRFDIVGFDPRGVGQSSPIGCGESVPAFRGSDLAPDTPAEAQLLEAAARAVADECAATEGARLGHLGSVEVARDIEVIRRALGEPKISFVGISYGTLLGQLWAEWYPGSVRALVLDGVVNPAAAGGADVSDVQARGVERTFHDIADRCAADPACPVGDDGGLVAAYDELARRLEAGEVRGAGVGPTQLAYAVFWATYDEATWPRLGAAVDRALAGDLSGVAELAGSFTRLVEYAPFAIVSCLDGPHPRGYADWQEGTAADRARSPRFGQILANELLPCAFWPAGTLEPTAVDAAGAPPILVVGSTGDAATPYETAVAVAESLESGSLLTVELAGHVAIDDSDCADAAITRYLVDLTVPGPGARC